MKGDLEVSTYQKRPCYRYIRASDQMPPIGTGDGIARVKLFDPTGSWTWFLSEYDPEERIAWGRVHGFEDEYGSISMEEICAVRGLFGLPIERDLHFTPRPLAECEMRRG